VNAAICAALGLNPVAYLSADPSLELVLGEVLVRAQKIADEWRQDLAVKIVNALSKSMRG
jgi:hypothetical protein